MIRRSLPSLVLACLAGLLVVLSAAPASAAKPCGQQLIDDWWDGRIDKSYPVHCYEQALDNMPPAARDYSDLESDLQRALQAAITTGGGEGGNQGGGGQNGNGQGGGESPQASPTVPGRQDGRDAAPGRRSFGVPGPRREPDGRGILGWMSPANADSIPVPLLVLAGLALLLLAAAATSFVAHRLHARRVPAGASTPPRTPRR